MRTMSGSRAVDVTHPIAPSEDVANGVVDAPTSAPIFFILPDFPPPATRMLVAPFGSSENRLRRRTTSPAIYIDITRYYATFLIFPRPRPRKTLAAAANLGPHWGMEAAQELPANTVKMEAHRPEKLANGKLRLLTLSHLDGRTKAAQRARELIDAILLDLGSDISEGTRQLVQRAGVLGTYIEDSETRWLNGEPVDLNHILSAINAQRRILATLGLERRAPRGTSLSDMMRADLAKQQAQSP
jgi:hypothetical protein